MVLYSIGRGVLCFRFKVFAINLFLEDYPFHLFGTDFFMLNFKII